MSYPFERWPQLETSRPDLLMCPEEGNSLEHVLQIARRQHRNVLDPIIHQFVPDKEGEEINAADEHSLAA